MSSPAVATPLLMTDPGFLWYAAIGVTEPTHTVTTSKFTDAMTAATGWVQLGATEEGGTFSAQTTFDTVTVAEILDPIKYVTTGRTASLAFALSDFTLANVKRALNGGTVTTSGTGVTAMNSLVPPTTGNEVRCQLLWEAQDATARIVCYQAINTGQVSMSFRKGADNAAIACEFQLEIPVGGNPYKVLTAGTARMGV